MKLLVDNESTKYLEKIRKVNALIAEGTKEAKEEALKLVLAGIKK
jgi:predicted secreted protein